LNQQFVHVLMVILEPQKLIVDYHLNLNVQLILNAQITLHVSEKNAKILALPQLVEPMLSVKYKGIVLFAPADQDMREIPIASVKNLGVRVMMSVL